MKPFYKRALTILKNMMQDNLHTKDVRQALYGGIRKVADAVGGTMGTGGSNAIIEAIESPGHIMTNDGYSIANAIVLKDPIEEMGRKILIESINRANKASGDGSSTTCVLTAAIIEEGMKHLGDASPMEIKRSLEECIPLIAKNVEEHKKDIELNEVGTVATISSEDPAIGKMIQDIYEQVGREGIIYWDISKTAEDAYTIGTGITVDGAGYVSPYMCDATEAGQSTNQIRIKNPYILITKQKISSAADFNSIGATLNGKEVKDLVVFCEDYDPLIVPDLVKTRMMRGFRFVLVKMPILWKDEWYVDLALTSGAKVIDPAAGLPMKELNESHLGRVGNIVVTKDDTFIDGIKDVDAHIAELTQIGDDKSLIRAARLKTKTARYFVGAHSDSALSYRRLKVEDAISASWQALHGGIVVGGGAALRNVTNELPQTVGGAILKIALLSPIKTIMANAGAPEGDQTSCLIEGGEYGYDTKSKEVVNMFEAGIVDPTNVVINSSKNAISVAAAVLTAQTVVTLPREEVSPRNPYEAHVR